MNGHDPYVYLKDMLTWLPTQRTSLIGPLLPVATAAISHFPPVMVMECQSKSAALSFVPHSSPTIKGPIRPFCTQTNSLDQPRPNGRGAVFCFPFLQRFMIATFGLYDFAGKRMFINPQ